MPLIIFKFYFSSKKLSAFHIHEYGEEQYDEVKELNFKICKTCDFKQEYEEL